MDRMAKNRGAPYILALLPARYTWANMSPEKLAESEGMQRRKWFVEHFYDDFLARKTPYPVLDLRAVFDDTELESSPYPGKETVHYTPEGMNILAKSIASSVVEEIKTLRKNKNHE